MMVVVLPAPLPPSRPTIGPGATAGNVQFPILPTDVFDYNAETGDSVFVNGTRSAAIPGGYDFLRPFALANNFSIQDLAVVGTTGSAQIEFANNVGFRAAKSKSPQGIARILKPRRTR